MSGAEIKQVSGVVGEIKKLGERAAKTAEKMRNTISDADQALSMTDQLADELGGVTAELRSVLGLNSNFPPADEQPAGISVLGQPVPVPEWTKKPE